MTPLYAPHKGRSEDSDLTPLLRVRAGAMLICVSTLTTPGPFDFLALPP